MRYRMLLVAALAAAPSAAGAQVVRRLPSPIRTAPDGSIAITLPGTLRGGDTVTGTIQLPENAPAGGMRVTFASDHADLAAAPAAVTVPAFQRSAGFRLGVTARRGTPAETVTISATGSGPGAPRGSRAVSIVQAAAAPVLVMSSANQPPVTAVAEPAQSAFASRLEPAPPVDSWQPHDQVAQGRTVVITGSGFRPADIAVRIGTRKLTIVEATATRVVARAPTAAEVPDPHYAGALTIGHAGGQLRTLTASYRVADRWDGYQPKALSTTRTRGLSLTSAVPRTWFTKFEVTLEGLPGDEVVGVEGEPRDGSCGQELYVSGARHPVMDGRVTLEVGMNFRLTALYCSALKLPLRLRYSDAPDDVRSVVVNLGGVQLRRTIRVERTQDLLDAGILSFTAYAPSGTCSGAVDGTTVGRTAVEGDVAFRVHDELPGTKCLWVLDQSSPGKWILRDDGWTISAFGWTEPYVTSGQRCHVQLQGGGSELGMYVFDRGQVYMGRGTRKMAADSIMNVSLGCSSTAQQAVTIGIDPKAPHELTARLDWVELAAPVEAAGWAELK